MTIWGGYEMNKYIPKDKIDEYEKKLLRLYFQHYAGDYTYCDIRTIESGNGKRENSRGKLVVRIGVPARVAGFEPGDVLYVRVDCRDIVLRKDWYGLPFRYHGNTKARRIILTPVLMALGYKKGDKLIVLAKKGEIRLKNMEEEFSKLLNEVNVLEEDELGDDKRAGETD